VFVDEEVIRPLDRPFSDKPPIVVLHASLRSRARHRQLGGAGRAQKPSSWAAVVYEPDPSYRSDSARDVHPAMCSSARDGPTG